MRSLCSLPALLFALWNVVNHRLTGGVPGTIDISVILLLSAIVFSLIHLTNAVGMDMAQVLVQTGYAFIFGLVMGAIFLRSEDLLAVIIAHALTDISSHVFPSGDSTPMIALILFIVLMAAEAGYAFRLVLKMEPEEVNENE